MSVCLFVYSRRGGGPGHSQTSGTLVSSSSGQQTRGPGWNHTLRCPSRQTPAGHAQLEDSGGGGGGGGEVMCMLPFTVHRQGFILKIIKNIFRGKASMDLGTTTGM